MIGQIREKTKEINAKIVESFYEEGMSVAALEATYGRSQSTIKKILREYRRRYQAEHGVDRERVRKPVDPRILVEKKSLSFVHAYVGLLISRYMAEHELTPTAFGAMLNPMRSRVQVSNMTVGAHDFTLTELVGLSRALGVPYERLVVPVQQKETTTANALA